MEVFCISIPPSKNDFRAKIPKEPAIQSRRITAGYASPTLRKPVTDIEMGRKAVWNETAEDEDDHEGIVRNDNSLDKNGGSVELSPDLSRILPPDPESSEGRGISHPRRSSWGRKSGSWDLSPEVIATAVGESKRATGGSNGNLTIDIKQSHKS